MENVVPVMSPAPGERLLRFVGDRVRFTLKNQNGQGRPKGWCARLRTNLGRAEVLRQEIIQAHAKGVPLAGASWCDLPMREDGEGWSQGRAAQRRGEEGGSGGAEDAFGDLVGELEHFEFFGFTEHGFSYPTRSQPSAARKLW